MFSEPYIHNDIITHKIKWVLHCKTHFIQFDSLESNKEDYKNYWCMYVKSLYLFLSVLDKERKVDSYMDHLPSIWRLLHFIHFINHHPFTRTPDNPLWCVYFSMYHSMVVVVVMYFLWINNFVVITWWEFGYAEITGDCDALHVRGVVAFFRFSSTSRVMLYGTCRISATT